MMGAIRDKKPVILRLEQNVCHELPGHISRLARSRQLARGRKSRGAVSGEPICLVRCLGCLLVSPFRIDLRASASVGDEVFRIPGLSYFNGVESGTGMVVRSGRITGRMCYGPPACDCTISELMEIK
jgi:hypothetical protein